MSTAQGTLQTVFAEHLIARSSLSQTRRLGFSTVCLFVFVFVCVRNISQQAMNRLH